MAKSKKSGSKDSNAGLRGWRYRSWGRGGFPVWTNRRSRWGRGGWRGGFEDEETPETHVFHHEASREHEANCEDESHGQEGRETDQVEQA